MKYRVFLVVMAVFVLSLPGVAVGAEGGQKWAVLVGINEYAHVEKLQCAVNDALRLAMTLMEVCGFPRDHVFLFTTAWEDALSRPGEAAYPEWFPEWLKTHAQPPRKELIQQCLDTLRDDPDDLCVKSDDCLLFYFSGHGMEWKSDKESLMYLVLPEANPEHPEEFGQTCLRSNELQTSLSELPAKQLLLILDACRSEFIPPSKDIHRIRSVMSDEMSKAFEVKRREEQEISTTLFACSTGQQSYEWRDKGHGFFTYFLVEGLRGAVATDTHTTTLSVTTGKLETYMGQEVNQAVGRKFEGKIEQVPRKVEDAKIGVPLVLAELTKVCLNAEPWAKVTIDGMEAGETPLTVYLAPRSHEVRFHRPGRPEVRKTVEVKAGEVAFVTPE